MVRKGRVSSTAVLSIVAFLAAAVPATAAANSKEPPGERLVKANDCISCHAVDRKIVGPAYRDVAKRYRGKPGAVQKLIQKVRRGGSGNWGQVPMTPHPSLSTMQLREMVEWILSLAAPAKKSAAQAKAPPQPAARQYSYMLANGSTAHLDFPLFVAGQEKKEVTKDIFHGYELYNSYCYRCHGQDVTGSEIAPDLRSSLNNGMTEQQFLSTAMAGREAKGMPSWAGFFSQQEIEEIYGYVKGRSLDLIPVGRPPSAMD